MAFLVARTAAAALPSVRAHRLGSGRLPLAALHGQGAVVLAGRKIGTGHGGVRPAITAMVPGRLVVKAACAKPGSEPDDMADEKDAELDFDVMKDLSSMYKNLSVMLPGVLPPPPEVPLSEEEKATQQKLKDIAERCVLLLADSMSIHIAHLTFARVALAAKTGSANAAMAVLVAETLDVVRTMVSSARKTPLPLREPERVGFYPPHGPIYGLESDTISNNFEVAWIAVLESQYKSVENDINSMILASI